ncbi:hypothetical protein JCM14076_06330 [Methylosoma difficile]
MPENEQSTVIDLATIMGELGTIKGSSDAHFTNLFAQLNNIRDDIRASEQRVNTRIDGVEDRVKVLEQDNKDQIKSIAKQSVITTAITTVIIQSGIEFCKRMAG